MKLKALLTMALVGLVGLAEAGAAPLKIASRRERRQK